MNNFADYYRGFKKMKEFMLNDLKNATIKGHANYLVAMSIFNYIEILGGFYFPCDVKEKEIKRFNFVFTDLLPKEYEKVFEEIRGNIAKPYNILRCGMTHGYLPTTIINNNLKINVSYVIFGADNQEQYDKCISDLQCGIELINQNKNAYLINIYNSRLINDFYSAFEALENKINNDDVYKSNFIIRANDINLHFLV